LTFSVRDTGIGILPEDQVRIFAPYERGSAARTSGVSGFGIGLALCQKLVGLMGAEIRVSSSPGQGSTFSFTLSCEASRDAAAPRPSPGGDTSPPRPTLLIVDDDPVALELMAMQLSPYDFVLLRARSGTDAARHWSCKIDLVITDQFMADGDGWTVLAQAVTRNVPTLLVSAAPPRRPPDLSEDVEFADVFQKPVDADALLAAIRRLLSTVRIGDRRAEHAVAAEATRPSEGIIAPLRQLIREGAVTKIDLWVRDAEQRHPSHRDFWSSIRASNARLDFARLHALVGDSDPTGEKAVAQGLKDADSTSP
jgi:CheY-like chemotaxis protein